MGIADYFKPVETMTPARSGRSWRRTGPRSTTSWTCASRRSTSGPIFRQPADPRCRASRPPRRTGPGEATIAY